MGSIYGLALEQVYKYILYHHIMSSGMSLGDGMRYLYLYSYS
jgi:hypothetical protein